MTRKYSPSTSASPGPGQVINSDREKVVMIQAVKERVTIQPGGRIELEHLDLPAGVEAEVIVIVELRTDSSTTPPEADKMISGGQLPNYQDLLQVPEADEADLWGWEWAGPEEGLQPRVLPRKASGEA